MSSRQRLVDTLIFGTPDKIPFWPGWPRESTLAEWYKQGFPKGKDWYKVLIGELGLPADADCSFGWLNPDSQMIPKFEEKILEHKDGHYIVQDWKGNVCEISDQYDLTYLREAKDFVTRRWIRCPVENRDDWEQMKIRYRIDQDQRVPSNLTEKAGKIKSKGQIGRISFAGPFWQMREWCGFEGLCMMLIDQPDLVAEMAEFWTDFISGILDKTISRGFVPDHVTINEDMAYKTKSMISPAMAREFCLPSWVKWTRRLRSAGCPIIEVDSDGFIGELIPLWIEAGINVCSPIEVAAGCDVADFRRQFGRQMAYIGGVDKRIMAKGGKEIQKHLAHLEPIVRDGGYIPACDHAVPADVSWPKYVEYARLLAKITGWLP